MGTVRVVLAKGCFPQGTSPPILGGNSWLATQSVLLTPNPDFPPWVVRTLHPGRTDGPALIGMWGGVEWGGVGWGQVGRDGVREGSQNHTISD